MFAARSDQVVRLDAHRVWVPGACGTGGCHLGVSEIRGTLFWGPYNKDPTI